MGSDLLEISFAEKALCFWLRTGRIAVCPYNNEGCLHAGLCWQEHSHEVVESDSYPLAAI